jgi:phosphocarrier protein
MTVRRVTVVNPLGLHARAAAKFVGLASRYACSIRVAAGARITEGKSILGLLLLAASQGSELVITTDGVDEAEAADALVLLTERGFDVTGAL